MKPAVSEQPKCSTWNTACGKGQEDQEYFEGLPISGNVAPWSVRYLQGSFQALREGTNRRFVPAVPSPLPDLLRLNEPCFLQNSHVVRDGWLRNVHPILQIASAKPGLFVEGTSALYFQGLQYLSPRGIRDGMQEIYKILINRTHGS